MKDEVTRIVESPEEDAELRRWLQEGREDLPSTAQLEAIGACLEKTIEAGPTHGPPSTVPPASAGGGTVGGTLLFGGMATVGIAAALLWWGSQPDPAPSRPAAAEVLTHTFQERTSAPVSEARAQHADPDILDQPTAADEEDSVVTQAAPSPAPLRASSDAVQRRGVHETPSRSELDLLTAAHVALREGAPRRALRLLGAHRRFYPNGLHAQERERFVVEALVELGRTVPAQRAASRFERRWPDSAHLSRVRTLVSPEAAGLVPEDPAP